MRNKEFQKLLKKQKYNSNSGFTLTELLVGLFMSIFVIGALGFGLMTVLRTTQTEGARVEARNEASRALEFITDEIRRARMIENDAANANGFNVANSKVVLALDIAEISGNSDPDGDGDLFGVDNDITTSERIVYYLKNENDTNIDPWQGPQVLYRWGPPLDANGNYTDGNWDSEALIDKIDDTTVTSGICGTGQTLTPATSASGFYACISDDDNDGNTENLTDTNTDGTISTADGYTVGSNDTNGDGVIDDEDGADVDGTGIAAQIYFTGGTATATESGSGYSADTQVVARARIAPESKSEDLTAYTVSFKSLGAVYGCNPSSGSKWTMRTDFINNSDDPDNQSGNNNKKWTHRPNRQPQPIKVDTSNDLEILSIPIESDDCISRGGNLAVNGITYDNTNIGEQGSVYQKDDSGNYILDSDGKPQLKSDVHVVKHTVDFDDPATYNGYVTDNIQVGDGTVVFLRKGSIIPGNVGYSPNGNDTNKQRSLGEFLYDPDPTVTGEPTYANNIGDRDGDGKDDYEIINIGKDERIVAFEVGQESTATDHPGFDLQDNIFILTSDVFSKVETDP